MWNLSTIPSEENGKTSGTDNAVATALMWTNKLSLDMQIHGVYYVR